MLQSIKLSDSLKSNIAQKQNVQGVQIYYDKKTIIIQKKIHQYTSKNKDNTDYLCIDRQTHQINVKDDFDLTKLTKRAFSAFLGIVVIKGYKFVVLCDQAKLNTNVDNIMIFQIVSLHFFSYLSDYQLSQKPQRKQVFKQIRELYEILRTGFYFSYKYNMTQSFQNQQLGIKNRFTWNIRFLKQLLNYNISKEWCIPLIQGYVNSFQIFIQGTKVSYILISRRSNKKAGTRYFDRGTDEDGYVANFVHTQQIVKIDDCFISDAQIRGSVPIFFQQKGLRTLIKLTRGYELTHQIFLKHFNKLKQKYNRIMFINLLAQGKRGQKIIITQLQKHFKQQQNDQNIKYMYYDFHKAVHDGNYSNVDEGIDRIRKMKLNLGYYVYNSKTQQILEEPQGIFRTNCLDCLDRTNFFQAKTALISLQNIFKKFNVQTPNLLQAMNNADGQNDLIVKFRHIWADNGDMISFHYTGTGSTHTDITRQGKRGITGQFIHKYKTITRFYNQNFWDFHKMNLVDLLLEQKSASSNSISIPQMVEQRADQYTEKSLLDIYFFSWKVPKKVPKLLTLFPTQPQMIVISLQQVSEVQKWNKIVKESLSKKYVLVGQKFSNNNLLKIYVQQDLKSRISNVELTKVKFKSYFNQYISTKCAIVIRFSYFNTKVVCCGCQLQYGRQFPQNRIQNLRDLHRYAFQQVQVGQKKHDNILSADAIFLLGNMNTHIDLQFKQQVTKLSPKSSYVLNVQERRFIQRMVQTDQFTRQIRQALLQFREYQQQQVKFIPTYKYDGKTFDPESSGWPDRIWYSSNNKIVCSLYSTIEQLRDNHVPVVGQYHLEVQKIDQDRRVRILQEIVNKFSTKQEIQEMEQFQQLQEDNTQVVERLNTPLKQHL